MTFIKQIQTDILKRHAGPFLFCFVTIMFILLMQFLMLYLDKIIGKGLPLSIIIELIITNLAYMIVLALPMAVLVSSLMAFGGFAETNQFTVLKSAGVHPLRLLNPVLAAGLILFIALAWFSNYVLPEANYKAKSLFIDIRLKKPGFDLKPNVFYEGIDGYTFLVKDLAKESDSLYDITLFQEPKRGKDRSVIRADRGILISEQDGQTITLYLNDGEITRFFSPKKTQTEMTEQTDFSRYRISFDISELIFTRTDHESRSRNDRTMSAEMMLAVIDSLDAEKQREIDRYAGNNTFTIPTSSTDSLTKESAIRIPDHILMLNDKATADSSISTPLASLNPFTFKKEQDILIRSASRSLRSKTINYQGLLTQIEHKSERQARYWVEVHKKLAIPFGCIIFVLIGAPLGLVARSGNIGVAAIISAIIFTFYWIALIQGEKLADRMFISPWLGMWGANIILAALGLVLTLKIVNDHLIRRSR